MGVKRRVGRVGVNERVGRTGVKRRVGRVDVNMVKTILKLINY